MVCNTRAATRLQHCTALVCLALNCTALSKEPGAGEGSFGGERRGGGGGPSDPPAANSKWSQRSTCRTRTTEPPPPTLTSPRTRCSRRLTTRGSKCQGDGTSLGRAVLNENRRRWKWDIGIVCAGNSRQGCYLAFAGGLPPRGHRLSQPQPSVGLSERDAGCHRSMLASSYMHEVLCPNNCGLCDFWAI